MACTNIEADNTTFVVLSFEGPDLYSQAGGLGVRVTNLSQTLASLNFPTHLFFIGDPRQKGEEISHGGRLILHRWCQWISEYHPRGVYQSENEKLWDFNRSLPSFVVECIVKPAVMQGRLVIIMGEEWQTAEVMCRLNDLLLSYGLRDKIVMFWNANNTFSFDRIDWRRLSQAATITTVSRYMKHIMCGLGLNPLVIPNGIPGHLLNRVNPRLTARVKQAVNADIILNKVARWDAAKRWNEALEVTARLKARGLRTVLLARGGIEPYGTEVMNKARSLGLKVRNVSAKGDSLDGFIEALGNTTGADILNIQFHCSQEFLRIVYQACDAVLANSGHEPFGLVGLETMAAGGIPITGGTGEDYAIPFHNAIVLETSDPEEIEAYVMYLVTHPAEAERIRRFARQTASLFTWEEVVKNLIQRLEYQASVQGLLVTPDRMPESEPEPYRFPERSSAHEVVPAGRV